MPTIRIENVPPTAEFHPNEVRKLYARLDEAIDDEPGQHKTTVLFAHEKHVALERGGTMKSAGRVRIHVLWHHRTFEVREDIVGAVREFLSSGGFNDTHFTFHDHDEGDSFCINGNWAGEIHSLAGGSF